jgi:putative transposase
MTQTIMDFVADQIADGRRCRALTVLDLFTRECLAIDVGQGLMVGISSPRSSAAYTNRVTLDFSRRGTPTDNAPIESFNGRFRDECLNVHWSASIDDAQQKIDAFRWDYNEHHPHRSLKGLSPREFAERMLHT